MILNHVPQCAGVVVVIPAPFHADCFADRDLHMVDDVGVPQTLEYDVCKTQCEKVLHCLLAEKMIDPICLAFGKHLPHIVDDLPGRLQIVADRLFEHDTAIVGHQFLAMQVLADCTIQVWRRREIEDAHAIGCRLQNAVELLPPFRLGPVHPGIKHLLQERVQRIVGKLFCAHMLPQCCLGALAVTVVVQIGSGCRNDPARCGKLLVLKAVIQSRQKLAQREVAGGAEHDHVELGDRDDRSCH